MKVHVLLLAVALASTACTPMAHAGKTSPALPRPRHVWVALLPHDEGLQYCAHLTPRSLAPSGAQDVYIRSLSAYVTTAAKDTSASTAITGREDLTD